MFISPLINNGALSLNANGDLSADFDIITQMAIALTAYNSIAADYMNSELLPFLDNKQVSFVNRTAITSIVVAAYQYLISQNVITNLTVSVQAQTLSTINLKISAVDVTRGNNVVLDWINQ